MSSGVRIRAYAAGDRDWLVAAHGRLYAEAEGFDETFPALVGEILDAFAASHDPARERGWVAEDAGGPLGSIFCEDRGGGVAKLRLFLLVPRARGRGLGRAMLERCLGFAQGAGYGRMTLWTHESHRAACALYAGAGFTCTGSTPVRSFGVDLVEQTWEIAL